MPLSTRISNIKANEYTVKPQENIINNKYKKI